jgi:hypothetical protein
VHRLGCARWSSTIVSKYLKATNRRCRSTVRAPPSRRPAPCSLDARAAPPSCCPAAKVLAENQSSTSPPASMIVCGGQASKRIVTKRARAPQSGHVRSKTNRRGRRERVRAVDCVKSNRALAHSLPTPLPRAVSGCNVKPNAKTAATTPAVESLDLGLLAAGLDHRTAVLCRSQAISMTYNCTVCRRETPQGRPLTDQSRR